jgi:plastocyanin
MPRFAPRVWLVVLLAGWLAGGPPGSLPAAGADAPKVHRVIIDAFAFQPAQLTLRPGDLVEWINRDIAPHTASAEKGSWSSGELPRGDRHRRRFTTPGRWSYFCAFHPTMRGEISVVAP